MLYVGFVAQPGSRDSGPHCPDIGSLRPAIQHVEQQVGAGCTRTRYEVVGIMLEKRHVMIGNTKYSRKTNVIYMLRYDTIRSTFYMIPDVIPWYHIVI